MGTINRLAGINLGRIHTWDGKKASSLTPVSFPGKNADETEGIDTLGVIAFIDFEGQWTGKFSEIQTYIAQIQSIIDGAQLSSSLLQSPFVNTTVGSSYRIGLINVNTSVSASKLVDTDANFLTRGIQSGDYVMNLDSGNTALVSADVTSEEELTIDTDIFESFPVAYAVTASMNTKLLNFEVRWELPGLSICNYKISVMQVK